MQDTDLDEPNTLTMNGLLRSRDRQLICLTDLARYLSTSQAARLLSSNLRPAAARKRLNALAGIPVTTRRPDVPSYRSVFNPPYLRRLRFRDFGGHAIDLWAVTPTGHTLACRELRAERRLPREDVGAAFLEHSMVLTDLFVTLAAPFVATGVHASELPFRWDPIDSRQLPWEEYDASSNKTRNRRIAPDAILELPGARRRLFVECEMGTHSIAAASDEKAGATLAKTERYDEFFAREFYAHSYPDRWPAQVLFLVRTDTRMASVNAALDAWRRGRAGVSVHARALTLGVAEAELLALLPPVPAAPHPRRRARAPTVTRAEAEVLKDFYQESLRRLDAVRRDFNRAPDPEFLELARRVRPVVARLCGAARTAASEPGP